MMRSTLFININVITKGGGQIKELHGGFKKALQLAYPEVTFTRWQRGIVFPPHPIVL